MRAASEGAVSPQASANVDDGTSAINTLCAIYLRYAAAPLVPAEPTPSPALNNLLRGTCASAAVESPLTRSSSASSLAALPLADAFATFNAPAVLSVPGQPEAMVVRAAAPMPAPEVRAVGSGSGAMAGSGLQVGTGQYVRAFTKFADDVNQALQEISAAASKRASTSSSTTSNNSNNSTRRSGSGN